MWLNKDILTMKVLYKTFCGISNNFGDKNQEKQNVTLHIWRVSPLGIVFRLQLKISKLI